MVGRQFGGNAYYTSAQIWKNVEYEHAGVLFSNKYAGRGDLFDGLKVWNDEKYRQLQGTYPVIFLSFAGVKAGNIKDLKAAVKIVIANLYAMFKDIMKSDIFDENDRESFFAVNERMEDVKAQMAITSLCIYLERYYGKEVIVLLDEYDTPMQEAWLGGCWDEPVGFFRSFLTIHLRRTRICTVES